MQIYGVSVASSLIALATRRGDCVYQETQFSMVSIK